MNQPFTVTVGEFQGPLDLLLTLIEERKMLISDVSLVSVADEFIEYVRRQESFPAGETAHFVVVAATLLLLKSRALLPVLELSEDEEQDIHQLEKRLALYALFRNAARTLASLTSPSYFGGLAKDTTPVFSPSKDASVQALNQAILEVLARAPKAEKRKEISVKTVISLEAMMNRLAERIERALSVTFKDFVGSPEDKREIVVGFLAVLELVKRGLLAVEQEAQFSDITMSYSGAAQPPRYD